MSLQPLVDNISDMVSVTELRSLSQSSLLTKAKIDLSNPRVTKASYLVLPGLIGVGVIATTLTCT